MMIFFHPDSLEWLNLGGNRLDSVPSKALRRLARLRQLDLRENKITAILEDDFQSFGKTLKFIYLQKNLYVFGVLIYETLVSMLFLLHDF